MQLEMDKRAEARIGRKRHHCRLFYQAPWQIERYCGNLWVATLDGETGAIAGGTSCKGEPVTDACKRKIQQVLFCSLPA